MTFAPGKLILSGEHSVVYGKPALAIPLSMGVSAHALHIEGPSTYKTAIEDSVLRTALSTVVPKEGIELHISSTLPIGKGLGSSAALSVAVCKEMARIQNTPLTFAQLLTQAQTMEMHFHGRASGLDHTVSALERGIEFTKSKDGIDWKGLTLPQMDILIIDSGTRGSTHDMVQQVAEGYSLPKIKDTIDEIGQLTTQMIESLYNHNISKFAQQCTTNHRLLAELGVSTPTLDYIVDTALDNGAWGAKLSGSGGGGIVMILGPNLQHLEAYYEQQGFEAFVVSTFS